MFLQCARVSILRAEKENGYSDVALILGLVLAWAKADFLLFTSKIVEHSRHLPLTKCETEPLRRAFTTLIRSSVINSSWQLNPCAGYLGHPFRKLACYARLNRLPCETGEMRVQSTRFILLALVFQRVNLHEGEVHSCCLCSPQSSNESVIIFTCSKNVCCVGSSHQQPRLCSVRSPISLEGNPNCLRKMRCYGNS